jgi:hypothetical protein
MGFCSKKMSWDLRPINALHVHKCNIEAYDTAAMLYLHVLAKICMSKFWCRLIVVYFFLNIYRDDF